MTRAQSNTLGFVLVFGLIALTTGAAFVGGFGALEDGQTAERINNMERAFEVLDGNVEDLTRRGAPSRATEIKLSGGTLELAGRTSISMTVTNTENASQNASFSTTTVPIAYRDDGTTITYAAGAIIRSDDGNAVMRSEPNWLIDDERMLVPFVVTYASGPTSSVGGTTTVLVVTDRETATLDGAFTTPNGTESARVNVTVESSNAEAWSRFLESKGPVDVPDEDPSDGDVTYTFLTERVYVTEFDIGVGLS